MWKFCYVILTNESFHLCYFWFLRIELFPETNLPLIWVTNLSHCCGNHPPPQQKRFYFSKTLSLSKHTVHLVWMLQIVDESCYFSDQMHLITIRALLHRVSRPQRTPLHPSTTWVMAFVIPNDSRNKSTIMRSHWLLFFFLKSPFTVLNSQPVSESQTVFKLQWTSVKHPPPTGDLPAAKMDSVSFWACLFFFLSQWLEFTSESLELISGLYVNAASCFQTSFFIFMGLFKSSSELISRFLLLLHLR